MGSHVVAGLTLDSGAESFATRSAAVADLAEELGLGRADRSAEPRRRLGPAAGGSAGTAEDRRPGHPRQPLGPRSPALPWPARLRPRLARRVAAGLRGDRCRGHQRGRPGPRPDGPARAGPARLAGGRRRALGRPGPAGRGHGGARAPRRNPHPRFPRRRRGRAAPRRCRPPGRAGAGARRPAPEQPGLQKAGSAVAGLRGGMHTLVAALVAELRGLDVTLLSGTRADAVQRIPGGWRVTAGRADVRRRAAGGRRGRPGRRRAARRTPLPALAALRPDAGPDVRLVTLVLDRPALDAAPRGTGVLVAPQSPGIRAKALTHATAKWAWLAERTAPGRHVAPALLRTRRQRPARRGRPGAPERRGVVRRRPGRTPPHCWPSRCPGPTSSAGTWCAGPARCRSRRSATSAGSSRSGSSARRRETSPSSGGWLSGNGLAAIVADTPKQVARCCPESGNPRPVTPVRLRALIPGKRAFGKFSPPTFCG